MRRLFTFTLFVGLVSASIAQDFSGFTVYTSKGKKTSVKKMLKAVSATDFVFFGEYHNDPIGHWLELEVFKAVHAVPRKVTPMLSFEMFEQDQQQLLDDYLNGKISEKDFEDSCRLWPNYETDYKPLIQYAKDNSIPVVAANIPRRYASLLFKRGRAALDSLTVEEKSWIAPLDFTVDTTLSQYATIHEMAAHMGSGNLLEAQAIKDATMAFFILKYRQPGQVVVQYNGAYHTDFYQGIIWYIELELKEVRKVTISTVSQEDISKLDDENKGRADFIICVDEDMTKTH